MAYEDRKVPDTPIQMMEELDYYDGPILLTAGTPDDIWMLMIHGEKLRERSFLAAPVSQAEVDAILADRLSLRASFIDRPLRIASWDQTGIVIAPEIVTVPDDRLSDVGTGLSPDAEGLPDRIADLATDTPTL